jgi:hypothetical protein
MKTHCKFAEMVPVKRLLAMRNPRNPNHHPQEQIDLFAKILRHQGFRRPVVVSKRSNLMVSGHGMLEAAIACKCKEVPVDFQDFPDEESETAHMMADNELAKFAQSDKAQMERLLSELEKSNFDLELTGIMERAEKTELKRLEFQRPPSRTWVLIGIETVRYGEINANIEAIAKVSGATVETTVASEEE